MAKTPMQINDLKPGQEFVVFFKPNHPINGRYYVQSIVADDRAVIKSWNSRLSKWDWEFLTQNQLDALADCIRWKK